MKELLQLINELLGTIIWPTVCLFTLFIFRKSIIDLISRITGIGSDKVRVDLESRSGQKVDDKKNPIDSLSGKSSNENIEKAIGLFSKSTVDLFSNAIKEETELESIETAEDREQTLFRYSQALYLLYHFNKIYSAIYGSQIRILQILNGSNLETKETVKFLYDFAKDRNPEYYMNYSYDQYLNFLESYDLISLDTNRKISITLLGRDFLKFIIEMGLTTEKLN